MTSTENTKVVYFHRRKDKDEIFYVGIGSEDRPYDKNGRNKIWSRIVNKSEYTVEIIHKGLTLEDAISYERKYIKQFGRKDLNLGPLSNMTDGGEGNQNQIMSEETKKKMSESRKGDKNWNYGRKKTFKEINKIAESKSLFTEKDVIFIRTEYSSGRMSSFELTKMFGVKPQNISRVTSRATWKHLPRLKNEITSRKEWDKKFHRFLTPEQILDIQKTYKKGKHGFGYTALSEKYNVNINVIRKIINKKRPC